MENTISKTKKQTQTLTSVIPAFRSQKEKEVGGQLGLYTKLPSRAKHSNPVS